MNILKVSAVLVLLAAVVSCNKTHADYSGSWQRDISDTILCIHGFERLSLRPDSALKITNRLNMAYNDSNLNFNTEFITTIKGRWNIENNSIVAYLDTLTYTFDTIPGSTSLNPVRNDITVDYGNSLIKMRDEILGNLNELYRDAYTVNNVLQIYRPIVMNDTILSGICGESTIIWHANPICMNR